MRRTPLPVLPSGGEHLYQLLAKEAEVAAARGDLDLAESKLRAAADEHERAFGPGHRDLPNTYNNLAVICERNLNYTDAERFYRRAHTLATSLLDANDPLVQTSYSNLKEFCDAHGVAIDDWPEFGATITAPGAPPPESELGLRAPRWRWRASWQSVTAGLWMLVAIALATTAYNLSSDSEPAETPESQLAAETAAFGQTEGSPTATSRPSSTVVVPGTRDPDSAINAAGRAGRPPIRTPGSASDTAAKVQTTADVGDIRVVTAGVCATLDRQASPWRCDPIVDAVPAGPVSYYTRVATSNTTRIMHRWLQDGRLRLTRSLDIAASPRDGYRAYSEEQLTPGQWRVELATEDGAILHDVTFRVR